MATTNANVRLNIPKRYRKGIMSHMGLLSVPFYKCNEVAPEGAPVKLNSDNTVSVMTAGDGETAFGLLAQKVYDATLLGELADYEFHNNTWARTGDTVGVFTGAGYVETINYTGSVSANDNLYPGPSGMLSATQSGSDAAIGVAEGAGEDGDVYIRVRVDFALK